MALKLIRIVLALYCQSIAGLYFGTNETDFTPTYYSSSNESIASIVEKVLPNRTICGYQKGASRIVGGTVTALGEFPWLGAIEFISKFTRKNAGVQCGGSLLNNRYVLTAAHCLLHFELEPINVWLGDWNLKEDPDCQVLIAMKECADPVVKAKIDEKLPHPFFSSRTRNNDIGIIRLEKNVHFTDYIQPICLPSPDTLEPQPGDYMTVSGWGITETGKSSDVKLKVSVPLLTNKECAEILKSYYVSPNQLCAGAVTGKDSCQGDSGGALMRTYQDMNINQQWYQEGVVGWGVGCGRAGYPAVYTRISRYTEWIVRTIYIDQNK